MSTGQIMKKDSMNALQDNLRFMSRYKLCQGQETRVEKVSHNTIDMQIHMPTILFWIDDTHVHE